MNIQSTGACAPNSCLLAYFHVNHGLGIPPLAITGALCATLGRAALAIVSRAFGARVIPRTRRARIDQVVAALQASTSLAVASLALFAVGPIPEGTLFIAASLARVSLLPCAIAFGVTRFAIYLASLLVADSAARTSLASRLRCANCMPAFSYQCVPRGDSSTMAIMEFTSYHFRHPSVA